MRLNRLENSFWSVNEHWLSGTIQHQITKEEMRKDSCFFQHCDDLVNENETPSLHSCPLSPSHTHPASLSEHSVGKWSICCWSQGTRERVVYFLNIKRPCCTQLSTSTSERRKECRQTVHCRARRQLWCSVKMQTLWLMLQLFGNQTCTRQSKGNSRLVALVQAKSDLHLLKVT